jgi:hypothetical protein
MDDTDSKRLVAARRYAAPCEQISQAPISARQALRYQTEQLLTELRELSTSIDIGD